MQITPVLFTAREAAHALGVERRTIARWVLSGRMKPAKQAGPQGAYVFTGEEVARVAALPRPRMGRPVRKAS